jgi:hypothetical protein
MTVNDTVKDKEGVMAYFRIPSQHLSGRTEENYKTSVRLADLWDEIQTHGFPNTKHECYPLKCDIHWQFIWYRTNSSYGDAVVFGVWSMDHILS